jgi:hypothetical protein
MPALEVADIFRMSATRALSVRSLAKKFGALVVQNDLCQPADGLPRTR